MRLSIHHYLMRPGLGQTLIKAIIGSAGLRLIGMGLGFLVGVQLARGLGAEGYGIYGLAMSIIALLGVPSEFGLPQLLTREVAAAQANEDWGRLRGVIRWATRMNLLVSLAVVLLALGWLLFSGNSLSSPLGLTVLGGLVMVPLVGQGNLRGAALCGLQHIVKGQIPEIVARPALFSILLFMVPWLAVPLNPGLAMGLGAVSALASLILAAWVLQKEIPLSAREAQPKLASRKWLSSAVPMALTNGMHILLGNTSLLLLGVFSTAAAVGIFRVATSLALLIGLPISLFNMISGPILSRIHAQQNPEAMQYVLAWLAAGMSIGTAVITLPVLVYGTELVDFSFGREFLAADYPLQILCIGMLLCSALGSNVIVLNMCGHEKRVTRAFGIALAFLAVAGIPLIHFYGLAGAAIANAGSMLLWNVMLFWDARRLLDMDTSLMAPLRNPRILIQHHGANPQ